MKNIVIVGVGGQGSLLASRIIGDYYLKKGQDVKISEVHGMSQRGGSVITYVRAGSRVDSPLVPVGEADLLIAFEQLEARRYMHYLKKDGTAAVSVQKVSPMPVIVGSAEYPADILGELAALTPNLVTVDALQLAEQAGSPKAANVVLLGRAAAELGGIKEHWLDAVRGAVPPKFTEMNITAFNLGYNTADKN